MKTTAVDTFLAKIAEVIINPILVLMFATAVAVFLWGVVQMLGNLDNEEARDNGKKHLLWGVVGMTIMFAVHGIIGMIKNTFGL